MEAAVTVENYHNTLTELEKRQRLRLIRTENIGPITFYQLIKKFGSAQAAISALPELAKKGGRKAPLKIAEDGIIDQEMRAIEKFGAKLLFHGDDGYPFLLSHITDAPPVLCVKGDVSFLKPNSIAIVGARNSSLNGRQFAKKLAQEFGEAGYTVVSGLARGIDKGAHDGSIKTGTIAVLAGGLNIVYPSENQAVYDEISCKGLLLAESAFGQQPSSSSFPRRNRIISGLCRGIVVIEAALKSGSLITADFGNEHGRDVFAVPGFPLDPRSQGCNQLIQDGAYLVQKYEDVIGNLSPLEQIININNSLGNFAKDIHESSMHGDYMDDDSLRKLILNNLSYFPIHIDELIRECGSSPARLHWLILELEVAGLVCRHPGHRISLISTI